MVKKIDHKSSSLMWIFK